jgi:hypothetical protein
MVLVIALVALDDLFADNFEEQELHERVHQILNATKERYIGSAGE